MQGFKAESECDPCGYPNEKHFHVICESDLFSSNNIDVSLQGLCHLSPFSTRLFTIYKEKKINDDGEEEIVSLKRIIFEKKI